jgi:hypothetical protein
MAIAGNLMRWGKGEFGERCARALPWIGTAVALALMLDTMRRKGVVRGGIDTALNALPIVGPVKNFAEGVAGREFIAERRRPSKALPQ